jgi:hypothetical protein
VEATGASTLFGCHRAYVLQRHWLVGPDVRDYLMCPSWRRDSARWAQSLSVTGSQHTNSLSLSQHSAATIGYEARCILVYRIVQKTNRSFNSYLHGWNGSAERSARSKGTQEFISQTKPWLSQPADLTLSKGTQAFYLMEAGRSSGY